MANTTNFNWETPDDTDLVKDGAAAIRTLGSAIDTSLVDLKGGTTGQVLSKATNTDMDFTWVAQDDSNAIQNAIIDAKGDLIVGTAADTPARLAVGTNDQVLTADSSTATGLKWATAASGSSFVGASLYNTVSTQTITNNTSTLVTWDAELFDTNGFHSTSTDTSRITIPSGKAGKYFFTATAFFDSNATGNRRLDLRKNGVLQRYFSTAATTNVFSGMTVNCILDLAVGDYIEIAAFQTSGGNLTLYRGNEGGLGQVNYGIFDCQYLGA